MPDLVLILFLVGGPIIIWIASKDFVRFFSLVSVYFITLLWPFNFFGLLEWVIALNLLILILITIVNKKNYPNNRKWLLSFGAFVYGSIAFGTYLWSEKIFMEKAIKLAAEIENGCSVSGECVRNLPGWKASDGENSSRGLSTKWEFFLHKTYVNYRIQPDRKSFYLQEIYQHGRMTTITLTDGRWSISHSGTMIRKFHREGTGKISLTGV